MATRGRGRHLFQAGRPGARRTALGTRRGRGHSGGAGPSWLGTARGGGGMGAVPVVWGLAHQAGRLCFLPGEVTVEGQHRGVAVLGLCGTDGAISGPLRPPAARPPWHKGARATSVPTLQVLGRLQQQQQGIQLHPAARARDGGGSCPARSCRLCSPHAPRLAAHQPDSRTPALDRHPPPQALKLTHKASGGRHIQ